MTVSRGEAQLRLTLVTPVFNEAGNLAEYVQQVDKVLMARDDIVVDVLFVDDGSSDESWSLILQAASQDPRFRGLRLSRNFGSHTAIWAALMNVGSDADAVAVLACDLQDPPETVLEFVDRWRQGYDIVWGVRRTRVDAGWRIALSRVFEAALRRFAMPRRSLFTTGSFLLLDRRVLEGVRQMGEHNRITFALVAWTGFEQARVEYDRRPRHAGTSGWSYRAMIKTMYDAFIGYSNLPIRLMTLAATAAFLVAAGLSVYVLIAGLVSHPVVGWASQMLIVSAFFAVQFSLTAVIGEYLYRIYSEVLRRPAYFISASTFEGARNSSAEP